MNKSELADPNSEEVIGNAAYIRNFNRVSECKAITKSRRKEWSRCRPLHLIICSCLFLWAGNGFADSATCSIAPYSGDWNTAANWLPTIVLNSAADTATFALSTVTSVSTSAFTQVHGIVFNPGASAFTISNSPVFTLSISGVGIINNSGVTQNFVTTVTSSSQSNGSVESISLGRSTSISITSSPCSSFTKL